MEDSSQWAGPDGFDPVSEEVLLEPLGQVPDNDDFEGLGDHWAEEVARQLEDEAARDPDEGGRGPLGRALARTVRAAERGGESAKESALAALSLMAGYFNGAGHKVARVFRLLAKLIERYRDDFAQLATALHASSFSIGVSPPTGVSFAVTFA